MDKPRKALESSSCTTPPPSIYNKNYYLNVCLGSEEFKKSKGQDVHPRIKSLLQNIHLDKTMHVLDIGCGRGDISIYLARFVKRVVGIDYSSDAIKIAKKLKENSVRTKRKLQFIQCDATSLPFADSSFDVIVAIDILEHLTKDDVVKMMREIKRVLKSNGQLFVHTGTNRILYNTTYPFYIYPINLLLTSVDKKYKNITYKSLPKDPRTKDEYLQHVNEPTYFYLKNLFRKFGFSGNFITEVGYIKDGTSMRTKLYNFIVTFYPLSKYFPLNLFFGWNFICLLRNTK